MKILVINIALRPPPARKWLPIGLAYVTSAMRRAGYQFDLLDLDAHPQAPDEVEQFLWANRYDVVAMGCIVTGYNKIKWISQMIRQAHPDTRIIVGNSVASSISEILLTKTGADIAIMGEGDETIVDLLDALNADRNLETVPGIHFLKDGSIIRNPLRPAIKDIDTIPIPDWDIFDVEVYIENLRGVMNEPLPMPADEIRAMPMNTARGCPYRCTFCFQVFREDKYRWRSPQSIITEMKWLQQKYGVNYFAFADELTFFSAKQAESFADALLASEMKVYWDADCRTGIFSKEEHVEVARKLKKAGLVALSYSLESANPDILKWMNKNVQPEMFSRQVDICNKAGLPTLTSIVIGYPNETEQTIKDTIDCCIANNIYPSAGYLLPQPGTGMYDFAVEQGYIKDQEAYLLAMGDRQDLRLNMTSLSDDALENITQRELARCSSELNIGLDAGKLLKTGAYKVGKNEELHKEG